MPSYPPKVGQLVKAARDIPLVGNTHISILSSVGPNNLPKGTRAEITNIQPMDIDLNCMDGNPSLGMDAWGLKIRVAKVVWGSDFEDA